MADKILILGGSQSEVPLITAAKQLGLEVVTSGNQPLHLGHRLSDFYIPGDFSQPDEMQDVFERSKCTYLVSAANDFAYLTACQVSRNKSLQGFDSVDVAHMLHHKHLFKPIAYSLGIPITRFKIIQPNQNTDFSNLDLKYPILVKPTDLTGGKGISLVEDPKHLSDAIDMALKLSKQSSLVVEEFFDGSLHSFSTIISSGRIVFEYADNEFCHTNPYLVSTSTSLANVPLHILKDLRHQTEKLANHLQLKDGILHAQFLYKNDEYRVLEYTRRCSGDLYSTVVERVTGLKHAQQFIRQSIGLPTELSWVNPVSQYISRHCIFATSIGTVQKIEQAPSIRPYVESIVSIWPRHHHFSKPNTEKVAVAMLHFHNLVDMKNHSANLNHTIRTLN
jgi:biotin carboxylase